MTPKRRYGRFLRFSGGPSWSIFDSDNSDPLTIARYNVANDQTELRVSVGDNGEPWDKFVVGYSVATAWYPRMTVQMDGKVEIGTSTPAQLLHVAGSAALT